MKKGLLFLALICFSGVLMAQNEEVAAEDTVQIKGIHPWDLPQNEKGIKPEIAHWSIIPHLGFNIFDGDFPNEQKHNVAIPSAGLAVEYNFTPTWNIGVEYMYNMYTVTGKGGDISVDTLLNGHMHKATAYVSFDLINLFFPRMHRKIFSILPYFGAGGAWYRRSHYFKDDYDELHQTGHKRGETNNYINADGENGPEHDSYYKMVGVIQAGANFEFNLNRTLALGLRANYSYFTRDYVDGRGYYKHSPYTAASKNNDGIFDITLNMRIKLEAVKKSHPRNMPSFAEFDKLLAKAEPAAAPAIIAPHDTVIIIRHDSVIVRESFRGKRNERVFNVFFDNDKYDLREDALATIFEASQVMEEDTSLYAVLIGYCDNTASKAHNFKLGDNRAKNVMEELNKEYAIPFDHMHNAGIGKIAARKSNKSFAPNRRVSIHLVDKETFELMKVELQDKNETKNTDENVPVTIENSGAVRVPKLNLKKEEMEPVETVSLEESSRKEEELIEQYQKRQHTVVTVEKGMTLARLARKYYNNSQCWVFIYAANTDKMTTPNDFREGMELIIPELTAEELKIEQKDVLKLYSITAHRKLMENKK